MAPPLNLCLRLVESIISTSEQSIDFPLFSDCIIFSNTLRPPYGPHQVVRSHDMSVQQIHGGFPYYATMVYREWYRKYAILLPFKGDTTIVSVANSRKKGLIPLRRS